MTGAESTATNQDGATRVRESEPPMPDWGYRIGNPLVTALLRSPLHGLVSDSLVLLTFTGRESGREYTTPVGYHRDGDTLVVFTHSQWWKNLRGGRPVRVRLRGERRSGVATPFPDPAAVDERVRRVIDQHGTARARRIGIVVEGEEPPTTDEVAAAVENTVAIEVDLAADG